MRENGGLEASQPCEVPALNVVKGLPSQGLICIAGCLVITLILLALYLSFYEIINGEKFGNNRY